MKVRIIKKNDMYIPQFRFLLFWCTFAEMNSNHTVERNTLKQAEEFVDNYIKVTKPIYSVIREYRIVEQADRNFR